MLSLKGIQKRFIPIMLDDWIPAFAGMTDFNKLSHFNGRRENDWIVDQIN